MQNVKPSIWFYLGCLISVLLMWILIGWARCNYILYYGTGERSVQFSIIFVGTIIMTFFVILRIINWPKINVLEFETAKLYFSTTTQLMVATYAICGIAFSILWGNLYTFAIENGYRPYIESLKYQGIMLLFFIILSSVTLLWTFLLPLMGQINIKVKEKK